MIVITGIGWINKKEYGCAVKKLRRDCTGIKSLHSHLQSESVFLYPVKNFGRFDAVSKMTCCVVALALHDAGILYSKNHKLETGILGANTAGCLQSNVFYFKDYVVNGRTLARGNLFIYTLPSSPMAEAAIYFGCRGPVLYIMFPHKQVASLLRNAERTILRGETSSMLAVKADEEEALCFVLAQEKNASREKVWALEDAVAIAEKNFCLDEMVNEFKKSRHDDLRKKENSENKTDISQMAETKKSAEI